MALAQISSQALRPVLKSLDGDRAPAARQTVSACLPLARLNSQKAGCLKSGDGTIFGRSLGVSRSLRATTRESRLRGPLAARAERSYVMIKPDGVQRGLVGEIITRFERKGFTLKGLKLFQCSKELAEAHYAELKEKPFFGKLVSYIISGPVVCMVWEGAGVVLSARKLIGATNPLAAEPGTIRGDFAVEVGRNVVHGSDSVENGEREIGMWFGGAEVVDWTPELTPWLKE